MWRPICQAIYWQNCATWTRADFLSVMTMRSFILAVAWACVTFAESGWMTTNWQPGGGLGANWDGCYIGVLAAIAAMRQ